LIAPAISATVVRRIGIGRRHTASVDATDQGLPEIDRFGICRIDLAANVVPAAVERHVARTAAHLEDGMNVPGEADAADGATARVRTAVGAAAIERAGIAHAGIGTRVRDGRGRAPRRAP
jgi:hypothetical protein